MTQAIRVEVKENGVACLKMLDEGGMNAFSDDFIRSFIDGLDELESRHKPKALVLSGLPGVFCGGAEKQTLIDLCDGKVRVKDLMISERLVNAPFPVIAAMEGHAIGGGLMLAACSDIAIAALESRYGVVFMNLGFTPGMGCTRLLAELMGPFTANEMMYTGACYKGRALARMHTQINYILPRNEVLAKAEDLAARISEKNVAAVHLLKQSLSLRKKKLLAEARVQEDLMHRLSFGFPETRRAIEELYGK
jgi:polyketide biosynthesis enoyl-CoA hydratase PksI